MDCSGTMGGWWVDAIRILNSTWCVEHRTRELLIVLVYCFVADMAVRVLVTTG